MSRKIPLITATFRIILLLLYILNDQDIRTGGYEQMRLRRVRTPEGVKFSRFDSKYFYMLGTNYYLNVYFRF